MPKLTKEQLQQVKYVSVEDFSQRIDAFDRIQDKLAFATRYILTYNQADNPDYPIDHIIKVAYMKIADKSSDLRSFYMETDANRGKAEEMVDPMVSHYSNDIGNQMFIANPVAYLKGQAKALSDEIHAKQWMSQEDTANAVSYGVVNNDYLTEEFEAKMIAFAKKPTVFDVNARLEHAFGGPKGFKKALDNTKPGVLSGFFGTRSVAAANLEQAWKAFNNPNHAYHGSLPTVQDAATKYLQHLFPSWKPNNVHPVPSEEDIARLKGTRKARALLSVNILKAVKAQKELESDHAALMDVCAAKNITFEQIPPLQEDVPEHKRANSFQMDVKNFLDQEEQVEQEDVAPNEAVSEKELDQDGIAAE